MAAPPTPPYAKRDSAVAGPAGFQGLDSEEIENVVSNEMQNSIGGNYLNTISEERRRALKYFYGRPFGNEVEGRSAVVLTDVMDTVNWIMPSLMRMFIGPARTIEIDANGPHTEQMAQDASHFINQRFRNSRTDPGFMFLYDMFFDALVQKNGIAKIWAEDISEPRVDEYRGVSEEEVILIQQQNPEAEITEAVESDSIQRVEIDPATGLPVTIDVPLYDIRTRQIKPRREIRQVCIPPEEFLIGGRDYELNDDTLFCAHRHRILKSDLIAMGIDPQVVADLPIASSGYDTWNSERTERYSSDELEAQVTSGRQDSASSKTWILEAFVRLDVDGDGYSERYMGTFSTDGSGSRVRLLRLQPTNYNPFSSIVPIRVPHRFFGISYADIVMDLQEIRSTLVRQMLDNTYLSNDPRMAVLNNQVNLEDLMDSRPGGYVRVKRLDALQPIPTAQLGPQPFNLLENLEALKEQRTGISRLNQGQDAASFNQTATGISTLIAMANARVEQLARMFAEGLRPHFQNYFLLCTQSGMKHELVKVNGKWETMNPSTWVPELQVRINIGITPAAEVQRVGNSQHLLETLANMMQAPNADVQRMVSPQNIYHAVEDLVSNMGYANPDKYVTDPRSQPPAPPEPPPIEERELELKRAVEMMNHQMDVLKLQVEAVQHQQRIDVQTHEIDTKAEVERDRMDSQEDIALIQQRGKNGNGRADH